MNDTKNPTTEEKEIFLTCSVSKVRTMTEHMDTQLNIIIGISSAIFVFSASHYDSQKSITFLLLTLFCSLSAVVGIVAIHPFKFMRKRAGKEGVVYNHTVNNHESHDHYCETLADAVKDEKSIIREYAIEIYNLYKFYYRPKRELYILSRNILLLGIILSAFSIAISFIISIGK